MPPECSEHLIDVHETNCCFPHMVEPSVTLYEKSTPPKFPPVIVTVAPPVGGILPGRMVVPSTGIEPYLHVQEIKPRASFNDSEPAFQVQADVREHGKRTADDA